jgi:uncharacterized protein DUF5666
MALVLRSVKVPGSRGFAASRCGLVPFLNRSCPLVVLLGLTLLVGCGGRNGGISPSSGGSNGGSASSTAVLISLGDMAMMPGDSGPPGDQIVSFELTIESVAVRSSNGAVSELLSNPRRLELSRLLLKHEPLLLANVARGSYSGVVVRVYNPVVSFIDSDGLLHEGVAASLTSPTETINIPFSIGSTPVFFILRPLLPSSVSFGGGKVVSVTPRFDTLGPVEVQGGVGIINDLVGRVTTVSGSSITIDVNGVGYTWDPNGAFTFATDSSTEFQGITALNELGTGMTVEVDAVFYSDGVLRANKIEVENNVASAVVVEGLARSLAPAQLQMMVREVHGPGDVTIPGVGIVLAVNASASTQFRLESEHVDLNNLDFVPTFDALTMAAGQNVRAAAASGGATIITADQLKLEEQSLEGIAGALTAGAVSDQFSFPLNLSADSAFAELTGQTSVVVILQPDTFVGIGDFISPCITCIAGNHVRVRGLLFFSGGQYRLVAESVGP